MEACKVARFLTNRAITSTETQRRKIQDMDFLEQIGIHVHWKDKKTGICKLETLRSVNLRKHFAATKL